MARQKRVFAKDSELAHIWANQTQDEGLTLGCNLIKAVELERFAKVLGIAA